MNSYNSQCKRVQGRCDRQMSDGARERSNCRQMPDGTRERSNCQMPDCTRERSNCQMSDCTRERSNCQMPDGTKEGSACRMQGKKDWPIGMTYVPMQKWQELYQPDDGFHQGTIFKELNLPFGGRRMC